ncbi:NfeD family protein [Rhodovulum steppense]|uniref:Membrane-bound serine protease (ClpP class) n=1 Tax=Rhodovulum steppense TaxID=540251 RepID=A0A4R1YUT5_9RHOB|nr:nodulation protein NfeD [Rhodovulum steppense]TCM84533.1 membrane-bound serine protease (ClpP class) [Rhodovulum steppense]
MRRKWNAAVAALLCLALGVALAAAQDPGAQDPGAQTRAPVVLVATIEGPVGPATVAHVHRAVGIATERQAEALVLRLNTPGGLADAMREVISEILASPVPVIGHVAPAGAHAASAGTFILYATHLAAMAPGTNIGAATPVQIGGMPEGLPGQDRPPGEGDAGEDSPPPPRNAMAAKATNDAVALIRSLAELHGRNADWGERAVREAASLSADAARDLGVIEIVAADLDALLAAADGRSVTVAGSARALATAGLPVETIAMTAMTRILSVLSNPNVALVLMMVGVYGLIFEFLSPGGIGPGVIGAICLTLGLYALNQLPLDFAGLGLIALGIAFMVAEAVTPTFGILGLGGLVAFVLGASMLIDTDVPEFQVSWWLIGTVAALSGAVLVLLIGAAFRSYRTRPASGRAAFIGTEARVLDWSGTEGFVWFEGERWHATGSAGLRPGDMATVRDMDGLTLRLDAATDSKGET